MFKVLAVMGSSLAALMGIQVTGPLRKTVSPGVGSHSSYLTNLEQKTSTSLPSLLLSEFKLSLGFLFLLNTGVHSFPYHFVAHSWSLLPTFIGNIKALQQVLTITSGHGSWMKLSLQGQQQLVMEMVDMQQLESHYFQTEISQQGDFFWMVTHRVGTSVEAIPI